MLMLITVTDDAHLYVDHKDRDAHWYVNVNHKDMGYSLVC